MCIRDRNRRFLIMSNASTNKCTRTRIFFPSITGGNYRLTWICCERRHLHLDANIQIPSSNYIFGILVRHFRILTFIDSFTDYNIRQYQKWFQNPDNDTPEGSSFRAGMPVNKPLLLLNLLIRT